MPKDKTAEYAEELNKLRLAAGKPTLEAISEQAKFQQRPLTVSTSSLSEWLRGINVPFERREAEFLITYLRGQVPRTSDYKVPSDNWWETTRQQALAERRRGGRPARRHPPLMVGPVTLPPPPAGFTGRTRQLTDLLNHLEPAPDLAEIGPDGQVTATVVVSAVAGMGGVGKTALALQAAHQAHVRGWFPGGILFDDLRGYSDESSHDVGAVADRFLRALGVKARDLPPTPDEKLDAWRALLTNLAASDSPLLVVLDNVRDPDQVEALLPKPPHRALITSRQALSALFAHRIDLDSLSEEEAVALLATALRLGDTGDTRVAAQPDAARRLAELCGYLPLALRIIAARLRNEPHRPLADQADELADASSRLDTMKYGAHGDKRPMEVRASFNLSYRHLDAPQAAAFRLLTAAAGPDISTEAASELIGADNTRDLLADLAQAYLLEVRGERWSMHDLIRVFANEHASAHADADHREAAVARLHAHYRTTAQDAAAHLDPLPEGVSDHFSDLAQALAWLDAERANLVATALAPAPLGNPRTTTALSSALAVYLDRRRFLDDMIAVAVAARAAARELADPDGEAVALNTLCIALAEAHRFDEAFSAGSRAAGIFAGLRRHDREAVALTHCGHALSEIGQFAHARGVCDRAVEICRELGDRRREAGALTNRGRALAELGLFRESIDDFSTAAEICRRLHDRSREAAALVNCGRARQAVGQFEDAIKDCTRAEEIFRDLGDLHGAAMALNNRGSAQREVGQFEEAIKDRTEAANIYHTFGDRHREAGAWNGMGMALAEAGQSDEAIAAFTRAAEIYRDLGDHRNENDMQWNLTQVRHEQ